MKIAVVYAAGPRQAREWLLDLPEGSCVADALSASGVLRDHPELQAMGADLQLGIWGRSCNTAQALKYLDRVEIYRSLRVDPKVARRERFTGQGVRGAGLFARKRAGAKAGY